MGKKRKPRTPHPDSSGDQNSVSGNVSNGGIVIQGRSAVVAINQNRGMELNEVTQIFEKLYRHIESLPPDPDVDKDEVIETVQKIEEEAMGDEVNETKLSRWMEYLNKIAPDIVDVMLASLSGPVSAGGVILKKIADQVNK